MPFSLPRAHKSTKLPPSKLDHNTDHCISLNTTDLHLPQRLAAGGRGGRRPRREPEEDHLLLLVLVHGEELLLLGVEEADDVAPLEDVVLVLAVLEEEGDLPRGLGVHHVHLE